MKTVVNFWKGRGKFQLKVVEEEAGVIAVDDVEAEAKAEICGTLPSSSSPRTPECESYRSSAHYTLT